VKLSLILTINNRSPEVSKRVADSFKLKGNVCDEVVVVLDRVADEVKSGAVGAYSGLFGQHTKFVMLDGDPGWKGPAKAWNAGFDAATGDLYYCISSEVVQDEHNVDTARAGCEDGRTVVFGACHNSEPENLVVGAEPGLLVSSAMPRPLGFIVCMPADKVKLVQGFDETFMKGFWYDDDDFFLRLWRTGLDFVFDDKIHGVHIAHDRPDLATEEGMAGIQRNRDYMLKKHGTDHPWNDLLRLEEYNDKRLAWRHV